MELRQLRAFADIADVGSLTKVAVVRGVAHSALSKQLAALEKGFGGKLFYRTGRGVVLTELGQSILPRVKALLIESEQLQNETRASAAVPMGQVTVGIQSSATRPLASQLFRRCRERFPGIHLRMMEGYSGHIEEWLANGRADIGIINRYGAQAIRRDDPLLTVSLFLVGHARDPVMAKKRIRFASLARLPLALPGVPNGLRLMLNDAARKEGIALQVAMDVDSLVVTKDLVAGGGVYTILPLHAVFDEVKSGRLRAAPLVDPRLSRALVLATTTQRPLTRASREVVGLIRELVKELGDAPSPQKKRAPL
jgi:LysR family nitrogen assimilation transcriptional regulator